jgi:peptidoglycan/LPS O-acetylase OafA/YrhL
MKTEGSVSEPLRTGAPPKHALDPVEIRYTVVPADLPLIHSSMRIPELDGLRGIAILLVLLYHGIFQKTGLGLPLLTRSLIVGRLAWSGVDLFFVLSGFLIGGILLDAKDSPSYFKTFYLRRAFRILPLYALVLAFSSFQFLNLHGPVGHLGSFPQSTIPFAAFLTFTQNWWMAWLGTFGVGGAAVTWSLAIEEQFYLTIPVIIRNLNRLHLAYVLSFVMLAAPLLRTVVFLTFAHAGFAAYVLTPCRADGLSLGVLCALLVRSQRSWDYLLAHRKSLCVLTGVLSLGLVVLTLTSEDPWPVLTATIGYSWLAFFYAACLLIAVTKASKLAERVLCNGALMQLGALAYCTYLVHVPLIGGARRVLGIWLPDSEMRLLLGGLIGLVLAPMIATLSWKFFEKPMLRLGRAYRY